MSKPLKIYKEAREESLNDTDIITVEFRSQEKEIRYIGFHSDEESLLKAQSCYGLIERAFYQGNDVSYLLD